MKTLLAIVHSMLGVALCAASIGANAALVHWRLSGVTFDDGTTAEGTFTYDDVAGTVILWNITVHRGAALLPFAYMPGDSVPVIQNYPAGGARQGVYFESVEAGHPHAFGVSARQLRLTSTSTFSAAVPVVPLDLATPGGNFGVECLDCGAFRLIVAGALQRVPLPPGIAEIPAVEFYHAGFDHYFLSADPAEIAGLDSGVFSGWARTGESFLVHSAGSYDAAPVKPVCRYYGLPSAGLDSHFYSADPAECYRVNRDYGTEWYAENGNVFQVILPDPMHGDCPGGSVQVFRLFNGRRDANHRYTTKPAIVAQMLALGWRREGYGPHAATMCAFEPPAP